MLMLYVNDDFLKIFSQHLRKITMHQEYPNSLLRLIWQRYSIFYVLCFNWFAHSDNISQIFEILHGWFISTSAIYMKHFSCKILPIIHLLILLVSVSFHIHSVFVSGNVHIHICLLKLTSAPITGYFF
jgi:hypothetical protein